MSKIWILSRPIRSGKTTEILNTLPYLGKVDGILCPDKEDLRYAYSIAEQQYLPLQVTKSHAPSDSIQIGRFYFLKEGFLSAQQILLDTLNKSLDWVIVDEIGKLEYQRNEGLEPALSAFINHHLKSSEATHILLVIRDFLLEDIIAHYQLQEAHIVHDLKQWRPQNP